MRDKQLEDIEKDILKDIHRELIHNTPIKSGRLVQSFVRGKKDLSTNVPYAPTVELGTRKRKAQLFLDKSIREVIK